ncbi:hypothetical protein SESBI_02009 [Sesbania bispinosa]|nr:hypothetical protein SESBI_02009 [Sesbania bispinosa]
MSDYWKRKVSIGRRLEEIEKELKRIKDRQDNLFDRIDLILKAMHETNKRNDQF